MEGILKFLPVSALYSVIALGLIKLGNSLKRKDTNTTGTLRFACATRCSSTALSVPKEETTATRPRSTPVAPSASSTRSIAAVSIPRL